MIKYALSCEGGHDFEGWFGSSADYDDQAARTLIACPQCGSLAVNKQIMAPAVAAARSVEAESLSRLRDHVEANFDDVGEDFAAEARAIHDGEAEQRGIYGQATGGEVLDLIKDGVPVAPMPPKPVKKSELN